MTIITDIIFTCGHCKRLFNRNHKGEKIYLDLKPKNSTHKRNSPPKRKNLFSRNFNIYCSYCKKYYGKSENGKKTYFPPQDIPAIKGNRSDGICKNCIAAGAFENYKENK